MWAESADVLLVDDDCELRESLQEYLQERGYVTVGARDGADAIQVALLHCPHVIVLDLQMPGMDGWHFLEHRRTDDYLARIPVVVVTAERSQLPITDAVAVMAKPIDEQALCALIEGLLHPVPARAAKK
jgi:CheY-like chemotaxis protein